MRYSSPNFFIQSKLVWIGTYELDKIIKKYLWLGSDIRHFVSVLGAGADNNFLFFISVKKSV